MNYIIFTIVPGFEVASQHLCWVLGTQEAIRSHSDIQTCKEDLDKGYYYDYRMHFSSYESLVTS